MIHIASLAALIAFSGPPAPAPDARFVCREPTTNEWLKQAPATDSAGFVQVDASRVVAVSSNLSDATALLMTADAVQISPHQVQQFTGQASRSDATPYLVRAVFPTSRPNVSVSWHGPDLYVFAGGLGCAPYLKHPIVVFLDQRPVQVFVSASAAL